MPFSTEEFNIMLEELLHAQPASFTMLCSIAEKTLRPSVRRWCAADADLAGQEFEDDIMNEIHIRLIKTCVSSFLLRQGVDAPVNADPVGFKNWMFKVALNIKRDFSNQVRKVTMHTRPVGEEEDLPAPAEADPQTQLTDAHEERLCRAFAIVLGADVQVYKVLTWMAQCLFILEQDITRIRSNELLLETFQRKTLFEMHEALLQAADQISWLQISEAQNQRLLKALNTPYDDVRVFGAVQYSEFFMKKGGKATISDWVNRMNSMIKRVMANEALNS